MTLHKINDDREVRKQNMRGARIGIKNTLLAILLNF